MIHVGQIINDELIEKLAWGKVLEEGWDDWNPHHQNTVRHYTADGDPNNDFYESLKYCDNWHFHHWEARYEDKDVTGNIERWIKFRLNDDGFYGPPADLDTTFCHAFTAFEPTVASELNIKDIKQCLRDAASDITWAISESFQIFLQTTNPCCWDDKSPQDRYGKGWIDDPQTRVTIIKWKNIPAYLDQFKNVIHNCKYRGHTINIKGGQYYTIYKQNGEIYSEGWL